MIICEIEFGETKFSTKMREGPRNRIRIYRFTVDNWWHSSKRAKSFTKFYKKIFYFIFLWKKKCKSKSNYISCKRNEQISHSILAYDFAAYNQLFYRTEKLENVRLSREKQITRQSQINNGVWSNTSLKVAFRPYKLTSLQNSIAAKRKANRTRMWLSWKKQESIKKMYLHQLEEVF